MKIPDILASFPPTRLWIALMLFATTFVMYIIRVNLSVSILGMVRTHKQTENETIKFDLPDVSFLHIIVIRNGVLQKNRIFTLFFFSMVHDTIGQILSKISS